MFGISGTPVLPVEGQQAGAEQLYDEVDLPQQRYQFDVFRTSMKWIAIVCGPISVLYFLSVPHSDNLWSVVLGLVFAVVTLYCACIYRKITKENFAWVVNIFFALATLTIMAVSIPQVDSFVIIGVLGTVIVLSLATVLDPVSNARRWVGVNVVAYLIVIAIRHSGTVEYLPLSTMGKVLQFFIPLAALVVIAQLNLVTISYLRTGLRLSEVQRRELLAQRGALSQLASELTQSNQELESFVYSASHDLRAPLRALNNYSLFLQEDCGSNLAGQCLDYVQGIAESAQNMETLIVDLLEYSRVGRVESDLRELDINAFLDSIIRQLNLRQEASITLPAESIKVQTHEILLRQILVNLMSNAAKFKRAGVMPEIVISTRRDAKNWELCVRDNGVGIDKKHFDQIFGVFQRLHTADEFEGTGIGLAIVRKAVDKLEGSISIESDLGSGTAFSVKFPLDQQIKEKSHVHG